MLAQWVYLLQVHGRSRKSRTRSSTGQVQKSEIRKVIYRTSEVILTESSKLVSSNSVGVAAASRVFVSSMATSSRSVQ